MVWAFSFNIADAGLKHCLIWLVRELSDTQHEHRQNQARHNT